jgi:hypothetical protein
MTWNEFVFVAAFCMLVYFAREAYRAFQEFKTDLDRLREQRRRRKAARR